MTLFAFFIGFAAGIVATVWALRIIVSALERAWDDEIHTDIQRDENGMLHINAKLADTQPIPIVNRSWEHE